MGAPSCRAARLCLYHWQADRAELSCRSTLPLPRPLMTPWHATGKEAVVFQTFEGNLLPTDSVGRRWLLTFVEFPFLIAATPFRTLAGRREASDEVAHGTPVYRSCDLPSLFPLPPFFFPLPVQTLSP